MQIISKTKLELYIMLAFLLVINFRIRKLKINSNIIPTKLNFIINPISLTIFKT